MFSAIVFSDKGGRVFDFPVGSPIRAVKSPIKNTIRVFKNEKWKKVIEKTADLRRRYFTSQADYKKTRTADRQIYQQQIWHKHSSAYAYWERSTAGWMRFNLVYLDGNDTIIKHKLEEPGSIGKTIFGGYRPFFTTKGTACCHAWSIKDELLEYSLSTKESPKIRRCTIEVNCEKKAPISFIIFQNNHVLLKAFINSKKIHEDDNKKTYNISGVEINEIYLLNRFPPSWWKEAISRQCIIKKNDTKQ